ncbi:sugar ABC transporter substrate-binding protein [Caldicellulosiruptor acetigenus]|uniref:sugar ABC transporter substrate-binding protein n=1 Tax=Caldicellulosiruptor acetigenus TaxID=301953 RepID=UPI0004069673|nr:substrate-binding domain-containing protein [Caldicellulosiruptor acetigenus]WAM36369.1 substrate-binding domain-containing protein [Caldicellulosiruptor acetigenus]
MKKILNFKVIIIGLAIVLTSIAIFLFAYIHFLKKNNFNRPFKIGFAMSTLKEERWFFDRKYLIDAAKEKGFEVEWTNANENDMTQYQQVKYLISKGINLLIIVPSSYDSAKNAIELANQKNIPVICYDRIALDANIDAYVGFNNQKIGEIMAKYLLKQSPSGNYVFILGNPKDYNTHQIKEGYRKILTPYINLGKINILLEDYCYKWKKEYAYEYVAKLLQAGKRIDAILAQNDSLAEGAISALAEKRLAGKIPVVGQDAELSACRRIVNGYQLMTVYKPIRKLSELAIEISEKLIKKEKLPSSKNFINNGYKMVPAYLVEPIAVTNRNMKLIIEEGYHSYEEIFGK